MQVEKDRLLKTVAEAIRKYGDDPERASRYAWFALGGTVPEMEPDQPGLYVAGDGRGFLKTATGYWLSTDGSQLYDTPTGCGDWDDVCRELSFDDFPLHPAKPVASDTLA